MAYVSGGNELLDARKILKHLGLMTGKSVADLGCGGAGHFIIPAAQIVGPNSRVYAVDIMKSVLETVASKARAIGINNIKQVWSNLEILGATNIKSESLDFALLINILFQSKNDQAVITEAVRLLKPQGRLLVIDWDKEETNFGPAAIDRISRDNVKKIAEKLSLKLIDEYQPGKYHYALTFEKS